MNRHKVAPLMAGVGLKEKTSPRQAAKSHGIGEKGELMFKGECERRGYEVVDRRKWAKFDFIVNRKLVEVKTSSKHRINHNKSLGWSFTAEHNKGHYDFAACYCQQPSSEGSGFWIICPASMVGKGFQFNPSIESNRSKYAPFIDRWDLLEAQSLDTQNV